MQQVSTHPITIEDLMQLDADKRFEVVDGILVEASVSAGFAHVIVIDNLYDLLKPYVRANQLGRVQTDGLTFVLHQHTAQNVRITRIPDLFFLRYNRIPANIDWTKPFSGAPNLAVEVVSPAEDAPKLLRKVADYLEYGTEEVWALYFLRQEVHVFTPEEAPRIYTASDTLTRPALFPNLSISVAKIFKLDDE